MLIIIISNAVDEKEQYKQEMETTFNELVSIRKQEQDIKNELYEQMKNAVIQKMIKIKDIEEQIELCKSIQDPIVRWLSLDLHISYERLLNELKNK